MFTARTVIRRLRSSSLPWLLGLLVVAGIYLSGCTWLRLDADKHGTRKISDLLSSPDKTKAVQPVDIEKVEVVKGGVDMGDVDNLAFSDSEFRHVLADVVDKRRRGSLEFLLLTYPDIAMSQLVAGPDEQLNPTQLAEVADAFDRIWMSPSARLWSAFVQHLGGENRDDGFVGKRRRFLECLSNGETDQALQLNLVRTADRMGDPPARIEARRLEASAHLLSGDSQKSIELLTTAVSLSKDDMPMQASRLQLLLGEAYRHHGDRQNWQAAWSAATTRESGMMRTRQLNDPAFWTKAAYLRPSGQPWPEQVVEDFMHILDGNGLSFPSELTDESHRESIVWAIVGLQSLHRHESQNALLAFKKAEAVADPSGLRQQLLLLEAVTMLDGGQAGPASPILLKLSSGTGLVADRARAVLGSLKLQHGSIDQGFNLLKSALKTVDQWPEEERLRAQADLALAYLIKGREQEGIALQDQMCQAFASRRMHNHAVQCLVNQAQYFDSTGQAGRQQQALHRLEQLRTEPMGS